MKNTELAQHAQNIRKNILSEVHAAASGHPGGSLSATDLVTTLYFDEMDIHEGNVASTKRDRFVLSKGHASPLLYAVLAEKGFLPKEELKTFRRIDSKLQGHPNMNYVKGVDMSTGSLGQGVSAAVGMALANRLDQNDYRVYTLLGDGECQEGQVWEASMAAAHYGLDNFCLIVDHNGLQIDGEVAKVMNVDSLEDKFKAFNFHVITVNGHDFDEIKAALQEARATKGKPTAIIAMTTKGKGVSFMENQAGWHGVAPNDEQYELAMNELGGAQE